jgi:diacylglycerol kinase family enzyme
MIEGADYAVVARSVDEEWAASLDDTELVAIGGGDGTVRKVFKELSGTERAATILPVGTANNIARSLGIAEDNLSRAIQGWAGGRVEPFGVGTAILSGGEERFVESVGGGSFAEAIARGREDHGEGDKIERGLRALGQVLGEAKSLRWDVEADGDDLSGEYLAVEAMNVREVGPNVPLAPNADPRDGGLDIVLVRPENRAGLAAYVESRLDDAEAELPELDRVRARRVSVRAPAGANLHVDDEPCALTGPSEVVASIRLATRVLLPG